jgi:ATP-dependent Zn protease
MEETAYHECGHALMAVRMGAVVQMLTLEPEQDDGPERFGEAQIYWPAPPKSAKEQAGKLVLIALAGPVAEMIYRGEPLHPGFVAEWADDWRRAWKAAEPLAADELTRLALLEETARQLHARLSRDQEWSALAALADALLAHETLEREEIDEVLAIWPV